MCTVVKHQYLHVSFIVLFHKFKQRTIKVSQIQHIDLAVVMCDQRNKCICVRILDHKQLTAIIIFRHNLGKAMITINKITVFVLCFQMTLFIK